MNIVRLEKHPEHITTLATWIYEEWGRNDPNRTVSHTEKVLSTKSDATGLPVSFMMLCDGVPGGLARLVTHDMDTRKSLSPWLADVFVQAQYRSRGIGSELCKTVVAEAKKLGFAKVFLFTPDRASFYERQGWSTIECTIYRDTKVVIMEMNFGEHS